MEKREKDSLTGAELWYTNTARAGERETEREGEGRGGGKVRGIALIAGRRAAGPHILKAQPFYICTNCFLLFSERRY